MDRVYQSNASNVTTPAPSPGSLGFVQSDVPLPSFMPTEWAPPVASVYPTLSVQEVPVW